MFSVFLLVIGIQNMGSKLVIISLLLPLLQGNEVAITLTVCCPDGFGLDQFLKCTEKELDERKHIKDLIEEAVGHANMTLNVLNSESNVFASYIGIAYQNSTLEERNKYSSDHCLDFSDDGSHLLFFPYKEVNVPGLNLSLYSCCETGHILNTTTDECQSSESNHSFRVMSLNEQFYELKAADYKFEAHKPDCSRMTHKYLHFDEEHCITGSDYKLPDFYVNAEGQLVMMEFSDIDEIISKDRYCLAVNGNCSTVARVCHDDSCSRGNCFTKCCPKNKKVTLDQDNSFDCHPVENESQEFIMEVKTASGKKVSTTFLNYTFRFGLPRCPEGTNQEIFDIERDRFRADAWFLRNGSLHFDTIDFSRTFDFYCYDEAIDEVPDSTPRPIVIICLEPLSNNDQRGHLEAQSVAMIISSFFHALTIITHVLLPPLWNLQGLTVVSQSLSLMINFLVLSYTKTATMIKGETDTECRALALSAYYFFEASFAWLAVMSYDVYVALSGSSSGNARRKIRLKTVGLYSLIGWGIPAIIVLIADLIDRSHLPHYVLRPYFAVYNCWFHKNQKILFAYLYGPASIFLLINIVFFILVAKKLYAASVNSLRLSQADQGKGKERMYAIFKLFILMGISWQCLLLVFHGLFQHFLVRVCVHSFHLQEKDT